MDINHTLFEEWERRFEALAEQIEPWQEEQKPSFGQYALHLCLYGENGFLPDEELALLATLESTLATAPHRLIKLVVDADYWQDVILLLRP
jgi:hypothetical protein